MAVPTLPVTFLASRRKMLLLLLGSAAFVAGGIWMYPEEPLIAILNVVFFGLCGLVSVVCLLPGASYLTLTTEGFWFASLYRKHFVAWKDVEPFTVAVIQTHKMVGWNYTAEFRGQKSLRRLNTVVAGIEAGLPDTYGYSASELARLMNAVRSTAASPGIPCQAPPPP